MLRLPMPFILVSFFIKRTPMKPYFSFFLMAVASIYQACAPAPAPMTPIDIPTFKKSYFSELSRLSDESEVSHLLPLKDEYYVISNTDNPYEADIVLFGDRHDSADVALDFFHFGLNYLKPNDVALFESDSSVLKTIFENFYSNAHIYNLSEVILRDRVFKWRDEFRTMERPKTALRLWLSRQKDAMRESLESYRKELKIERTAWHAVASDGWDKQELIDKKNPLKNIKARNQSQADTIKAYLKQNRRILVFAGSYHVPHYQIAYSKMILMKENNPTPLMLQMIATTSVDEFFKLCLSLPDSFIQESYCDATLSIWKTLKESGKSFTLLVKKDPKKTYEPIIGTFKEFKIIREKNLVPTKI